MAVVLRAYWEWDRTQENQDAKDTCAEDDERWSPEAEGMFDTVETTGRAALVVTLSGE
jgi:hypothetical protein